MLLEALLDGVRVTGVMTPGKDRFSGNIISRIRVAGIATDCSRVQSGDVFVCIIGEHTDGHLYAALWRVWLRGLSFWESL